MGLIKIVFLGMPSVGKTTFKKIFFEEEDPEKLLKNPLEPTIDLDISYCEVGKKIAIHDLAGQNIADWFENRYSVFYKTDLLIIMVDATETWEKNEQIWLRFHRVNKIQKFRCKIYILFHKIDLLTKKDLRELKNKIQNYSFNQINAFPYLTSIEKSYFSQTLTNVIQILKQSIRSYTTTLDENLMKLNFLEKAVNQRTIRFSDLALPGIDMDKMLTLYFQDLEEMGFLHIDHSLKSLRITLKGREFVEKFKGRVFHKLMDNQTSLFTYLKGFILSDNFGRPFFEYESRPNIFKEMFSQLGENVDKSMILPLRLYNNIYLYLTTFSN